MRLATARDELVPLRDDRVRENPPYLTVVLLSRVITRIGTVADVHAGRRGGPVRLRPGVPAGLLPADQQRGPHPRERDLPGVRAPVRGRPRGWAPGGIVTYAADRIYEEVAYVAYHFHWSLDEHPRPRTRRAAALRGRDREHQHPDEPGTVTPMWRWPWRAQRTVQRSAASAASASTGDAGPPAGAPTHRRDEPPAWLGLPAIQRVTPDEPRLNLPESFTGSLAAWRDPSYLSPLGHLVGAGEPAGVLHGAVLPVPEPAPADPGTAGGTPADTLTSLPLVTPPPEARRTAPSLQRQIGCAGGAAAGRVARGTTGPGGARDGQPPADRAAGSAGTAPAGRRPAGRPGPADRRQRRARPDRRARGARDAREAGRADARAGRSAGGPRHVPRRTGRVPGRGRADGA